MCFRVPKHGRPSEGDGRTSRMGIKVSAASFTLLGEVWGSPLGTDQNLVRPPSALFVRQGDKLIGNIFKEGHYLNFFKA